MSIKRFPNLFLIGAAKSGTTSLAEYFKKRNDIFMPSLKEPFYFIDDYAMSSEKEYLGLYKEWKDEKYAVDASTGYLFSEMALKRAKAKSENAKVIILLRNPIDMSFSYWKFMVANGGERKEFEHCITDDERRRRTTEEFKNECLNWPCSYLYLERACYFEQVKTAIEIFSSENVKVELFENVISNFSGYINSLDEFLNLEQDNIGVNELPKENEAKLNSPVVDFLRNSKLLSPVKSFLRKFIDIKLRDKIRKKIYFSSVLRGKKDERKLSEEQRVFLKKYFNEDVEKLKFLLPEIDFSRWVDFNDKL